MVHRFWILFLLLFVPVASADVHLDNLGCSNNQLPYKHQGQWSCYDLSALGGSGGGCTPDDQLGIGNGSTTTCTTIPTCLDTAGQHINYDPSTNSLICGTSGGASCTADDKIAVGSGSAGVCTSLPNCDPTFQVDHYDPATNAWTCIDINTMLSTNGGTTTWDNGRHLMYAQPSGNSGELFYSGVTSGEVTGIGTAVASPTTLTTHVTLRRCATTSGVQCGWVGAGTANAHGIIKWRHDYAWKLYYTSAGTGGADDTLFNMFVGFGGVGSIDTITPCSLAWTNPSTGYWFCFNKSQQSTWLNCSGNGTTGSCHDTGVAAPASGSVWTMRIDTRDMANVKYYINNSLVDTRTTNLPASSSTVTVGRVADIKTTAITTQVQFGISYIRSTWD